MNHILAWIVFGLLLVYMVAELSFGGGRRGQEGRGRGYDWRGHLPHDILWIRWRRRGLYPPEPPDDPKKPKPDKPKPRLPELVD